MAASTMSAREMLARRSRAIAPGMRQRMFAAAAGITDLIALGLGDPDFATAPHIIAAAKQALDDGYTHYTPFAGLPQLREAIAEKLETENGVRADPKREIVVTSGAQEALFI